MRTLEPHSLKSAPHGPACHHQDSLLPSCNALTSCVLDLSRATRIWRPSVGLEASCGHEHAYPTWCRQRFRTEIAGSSHWRLSGAPLTASVCTRARRSVTLATYTPVFLLVAWGARRGEICLFSSVQPRPTPHAQAQPVPGTPQCWRAPGASSAAITAPPGPSPQSLECLLLPCPWPPRSGNPLMSGSSEAPSIT